MKNQMKSINESAPVKCSKSITIEADAKKVWAVLTNINIWATWQADITKPIMTGELLPGSTFHWKTGGVKIHSTLHTVEPFEKFGWTGKTFGLFAIHNWTLIASKGQTTVKVDESMEGFMATIFKKAFNESLDKGMQYWLEALKKECEK